ncbi:hypothetical protein [Alteromonas sp. C1M14]|uniref:hypothetical protein n=1 Tax=Alteromonas sp. C1M14 TaxID=2841567 RepID=UPI001C099824|nr:hypothetical protein [Alteromonas sp. C1M14]MBU2979948.1 hypothetical protein [Alteromonas sp. C1M14]
MKIIFIVIVLFLISIKFVMSEDKIKVLPCGSYNNCVFGSYTVSPESPSKEKIMYLEIDEEDRTGAIRIYNKKNMIEKFNNIIPVSLVDPHNGARQYWNDENTIVYQDGYQTIKIFDIDKSELKAEIDGKLGLINAKNKILVKKDFHSATNSPGIYVYSILEKDESLIISYKDLEAKFCLDDEKCKLKDVWNLKFSEDGNSIFFRVDLMIGKTKTQYLAKYDGKSIIKRDLMIHYLIAKDGVYGGVDNFLTKVDLDFESSEKINLQVNHFDISSDLVATDSAYYSEIIYIKLCKMSNFECETVFSNNFDDLVWEHFYHLNPSFSDDGKRLYFNYPISENSVQAAYITL